MSGSRTVNNRTAKQIAKDILGIDIRFVDDEVVIDLAANKGVLNPRRDQCVNCGCKIKPGKAGRSCKDCRE